jgi:hypothetical protein
MYRLPARTHALTAATMLCCLAGAAHAQCGMALAMLSANDKQIGDQLGRSVALSPVNGGGLTLMAGAINHDVNGVPNSGAVYTFGRVNNIWGQLSTIVPNDPATATLFGRELDYTDPYAIVGAPGAGAGGSIYIFDRAGSTWTQRLKWSDSPGFGLGNSVSIDSTSGMAIAGCPYAEFTIWGHPITNGGAVRLFRRDPATGAWSGTSYFILSGMEGEARDEDHYGYSVALSGYSFIAGAPGYDVTDPVTQATISNAGAIQIKRYHTGFATWYYDYIFTNPHPAAEDNFGAVVAHRDTYYAIAAPGRDVNGSANVGVVYIYHDLGDFWEPNRVLEAILQPTSTTANAGFGSSIRFSGDRIIVGSSGQHQVHIFRRLATGQWVQDARISDPDGPDAFGEAVAISGSDIALGDHLEDPTGVSDAGAAYVYQLSGTSADSCAGAIPVTAGAYAACTQNATVDGSNSCGGLPTSPDIWFKYTAAATGSLTLNTFGSAIDTVLSAHSGCPGSGANTLACNDDYSIFETGSSITLQVVTGQAYTIRISGKGTARGAVTLNVGPVVPTCYANCDNSIIAPVLNVGDFTCFLQRFAAGESYANCDSSTTAPVLNVGDFTCFLQRFAAGCP